MKILKRYYIFIFILAFAAGIFITELGRSKFAVIKTSEEYEITGAEYEEDGAEEDKVNINTASRRLLMTLDGVGERTAERIIEYREENGGFETAEDIMKVNGIGYEKFLELRDHITVE